MDPQLKFSLDIKADAIILTYIKKTGEGLVLICWDFLQKVKAIPKKVQKGLGKKGKETSFWFLWQL